jgi:signal transduction histidine kinase
LLDIEKIKSGMLNIQPETLQAREILEAAIEESSGFAAEMGVSLKLRPGNASVKADPQMLPRIIANLLSNAIKFSPPGGTVTLQARTSGNSVIFSVEDQGPGLSPEDQNQIFERFQQVGNQTARTRGGSGLGLTICKEMVEIHGGKIWVESSKGEGSTFLFTMPRTS